MATKKAGTARRTKKTKRKANASDAASSDATTKPRFPYATKPNSLRRFLLLVPQKPRPAKVNAETLRAWDLRDTNDRSIIRVLKALGLVSPTNEPTDRYTQFMSPNTGPTVLAAAVREVWAPLFEASHQPHLEDDNTLRNYFHIHSGGGDRAIQYQIQSFKAACDHADFGAPASASPAATTSTPGRTATAAVSPGGRAAVHIDLHIHLPENKSRRDYECIFEDIARYIFGREVGGHSDDAS